MKNSHARYALFITRTLINRFSRINSAGRHLLSCTLLSFSLNSDHNLISAISPNTS